MTRAFLAVLFLGCGTASPPPSGAAPAEASPPRTIPPIGDHVEGCYVEEAGPSPFTCTTDADCTSGGLFDPVRCCMSGVSHAHSRAYHDWQVAAFRARCDGACIEPPAMPADCALALRCDAGRCRDDCGAVRTASDAELDGMERGELEMLCDQGSTSACDRLGH